MAQLITGLDIGGAHLKAAQVTQAVTQSRCSEYSSYERIRCPW